MTPLAVVFMAVSWGFVLGLTAWSFHRILGARPGREDRDGGGGGQPPPT